MTFSSATPAGGGLVGIGWLARRWFPRRGLAAIPAAMVVAIGVAGTVAAIAASVRTETAFAEYLERADVGNVVINPSLNTQEIGELIGALPQIDQVTSDVMLAVSNDLGEPRSRRAFDAGVDRVTRVDADAPGGYLAYEADVDGMLVRGSTSGRYLDMDRPVVREGRMPTGPNEAVLTVEAAEGTRLQVGDVVPLSFWAPGIPAPDEDYDAFYSQVISPVGIEHVEVVGIVTLADEVLPDDLFPRQRFILSPDVVARYDCLPASPPPDSTWAQNVAALAPEGCAVNYRYYSLSFTGGSADVKAALDVFVRSAGELNTELARISDLPEGAEPPQYWLISTETDQERQRVERSIRPTTTALMVLGLASAIVTIALAGLLAVRELRRTHADQTQWHQLGVGRSLRAAVTMAPLLLAVGVATVVGTVAGSVLDPGPIGLVGVLEPEPAVRMIPEAVLAAVAVGIVVVVIVIGVALRTARLKPAPRRSDVWHPVGRIARTFPPAEADGIRAAFQPRTAVPVVASGVLLVAALTAAATFGAGLSKLIRTPAAYGWPWEAAGMTGYGYGDLDIADAETRFGADPDVADWAAFGLLNDVAVNEEPTMAVVGLDRTTTVDLPLLRGSLPRTASEVALGATTASRLDVDVGDRIELGGVIDPPRPAIVTGIAVFPTLGPLLSERVGGGTGLLLTETVFDGTGTSTFADAVDLATFIGVNLRDDADTPAARARVQDDVAQLDRLGGGVRNYPVAVRPPEVIDARSTAGVPIVVVAVVGVLGVFGLVLSSWASVRSRRRDLAILRSLGFDRRQVRRAIQAQAVVTVAATFAVGVPAGVVIGRALWRSFATELGVIPDPATPWRVLIVVAVAAAVLAAVIALGPARQVAHTAPADGLRTE